MKTKQEAGEILGLKSFDCALPQTWVDACYERGWDVRPHFVWSYDDIMLSGAPHPVTKEGNRMAGQMAAFIS